MQTATAPPVPVPRAPARPAGAGRRLRWTWPLAALLAFPIGGYIANLTVGAVDSV